MCLLHLQAAAYAAEASPPAEAATAATAEQDTQQGEDESPIQAKLAQELREKGFSNFRFVRAPANYYDESLEFRMGILNAASTHHLCKSMIMENTRAHPSTDGWKDPNNSKYYIVIVQVCLCAMVQRQQQSSAARCLWYQSHGLTAT